MQDLCGDCWFDCKTGAQCRIHTVTVVVLQDTDQWEMSLQMPQICFCSVRLCHCSVGFNGSERMGTVEYKPRVLMHNRLLMLMLMLMAAHNAGSVLNSVGQQNLMASHTVNVNLIV